MAKRMTRTFVTTVALLITLSLLLSVGVLGGMRASAAEADATDAGWYLLGNGAGSLQGDSWTDWSKGIMLTPDENDSHVFYADELTLYAGDQFKFLYQTGDFETPNDSYWLEGYVGGFDQIDGDKGEEYAFIDGGLGNIQVNNGHDGIYSFVLTVTPGSGTVSSEDGKLTLPAQSVSITYTLIRRLSPRVEYDMYVVGSIASDESVGWPGETGKTMLKMYPRQVPVLDAEGNETGEYVTKYFSEAIKFETTDEIKVYNAFNNAYYPSGVNNNRSPDADGYYVIEWEETAPDFEFRKCDETGAPYWPAPDTNAR